ncbi:hypothetical protein AVEN_215454-1 [Araneus ventricosus]|uniref:Uncharacterized protein n=1 Tax=Araneus ventricosus TaxID=182803 RepID=A0A4Y2JQR4_ARAVE|nr:hypothetical protein AVEN_215454-1 [Araneus ventricosus]
MMQWKRMFDDLEFMKSDGQAYLHIFVRDSMTVLRRRNNILEPYVFLLRDIVDRNGNSGPHWRIWFWKELKTVFLEKCNRLPEGLTHSGSYESKLSELYNRKKVPYLQLAQLFCCLMTPLCFLKASCVDDS